MTEPIPPNCRVFIATQHPWGDYLELRIGHSNRDGQRFIAKPIEFEAVGTPADFATIPATEPTILIPARSFEGPSVVQQIMDQLWAIGVRPSDIGSPGHLAATQQHLADMRALVSKAYETPLPAQK